MIATPLFLFFLGVVFVLVWLFAKTIDNRKWLTFLISLVLTPVVYFYIFYPLLNIFCSFHHQKYFDELAWNEKPALRFEMSKEILEKQLFIGKSKNEVEALLGASEWFGWDDSLKLNSSNKWNYKMGYKPGAFNLSQECLELVFKNNKVSSTTQYQLESTFE